MKRYLRATTLEDLSVLEPGAWDGVAFGAEFCHRRLPTPAQVRRCRARCRDGGLGFMLVTPLVREGAFERVCRWLEALAPDVLGDEWVFSDWGLLLWARERGFDLRPCVGRLLGRQRRDPRVVSLAAEAGAEEAEALRGSLWDDRVSADLLADLGVRRVELDWLLQGTRRPDLPPGVSLSLCGPWVPVTLSPSCPWSSDPLRCPRTCQDYGPVLQRSAEDAEPLWSRGNALFARVTSAPCPKDLDALGADRLVWAQELPG